MGPAGEPPPTPTLSLRSVIASRPMLSTDFEAFLTRYPDLRKEILHSQLKSQALRRAGHKSRKMLSGRSAVGSESSFISLPDTYDEGGDCACA